jgi:hypothetical protein
MYCRARYTNPLNNKKRRYAPRTSYLLTFSSEKRAETTTMTLTTCAKIKEISVQRHMVLIARLLLIVSLARSAGDILGNVSSAVHYFCIAQQAAGSEHFV